MSKYPVISIIVPVFNIQDYIETCIASILSQNNTDVELILVDDGSTDKSGVICDSYAANSSVIVLHQKNQGVSTARNNGMKKASGKYIYFVDGDDLLAPGSIEAILDKIVLSDADIISGAYVKFLDSDKIISSDIVKDEVIQAVESKSGHEALMELIKKSIFMPNVSTSIVKRSLFDDNKILFKVGMSNTEDLNCGMQLYINAEKIAVLKEPIYYYRQQRQGSLTNTRSKKSVEDSLIFIDTWTQQIESLRDEDVAKVWLRDYIAYQYLIAIGLTYVCNKNDRDALASRLAAKRQLLESRLSKKTKFAGMFYDIFGLNATGWMLSLNIKRKTMNSRFPYAVHRIFTSLSGVRNGA